jgi:hypothetical protein
MMMAGDPCYRLNSGAPVFTLPHRVTLADGSTRTDSTQWFPLHGADLGWAESTVTEQEAAAYEAEQVEQLRQAKIQQLHTWWNSHLGIEVTEGVVLPIQEKGRNTNASSLALALLTQSSTVDLVSVEDYTVTIPAAEAITALGVFRAAYDPISATWDTTHQALVAAINREELDAVEMPE